MWKKVYKDQIKSVPVGSKIHVCGVTTTLTRHYEEGDSGFDMEHVISIKGPFPCDVFSDWDWRIIPYIEVWEEHKEEEDMKEYIKAYLKENLRVEVERDPYSQYTTIKLLLEDEWISADSFNL